MLTSPPAESADTATRIFDAVRYQHRAALPSDSQCAALAIAVTALGGLVCAADELPLALTDGRLLTGCGVTVGGVTPVDVRDRNGHRLLSGAVRADGTLVAQLACPAGRPEVVS